MLYFITINVTTVDWLMSIEIFLVLDDLRRADDDHLGALHRDGLCGPARWPR